MYHACVCGVLIALSPCLVWAAQANVQAKVDTGLTRRSSATKQMRTSKHGAPLEGEESSFRTDVDGEEQDGRTGCRE